MKEYWDARLSSETEFSGPGTSGYTEAYNEALYRFNRHIVDLLVEPLPLDWKGSTVLDVGSGRGFWVRYLLGRASRVESVEVTDFGASSIARMFPSVKVHQGDVANPGTLPTSARYDAITAISVFIHIVPDAKLRSALANLSAHLRPGGYLIFNETFLPASRTLGDGRNRSHADWESLLEPAGLTIEREVPSHILMARNRAFDLLGQIRPRLLLFGDEVLLRLSDNTGRFPRSPLARVLRPRSVYLAARKR